MCTVEYFVIEYFVKIGSTLDLPCVSPVSSIQVVPGSSSSQPLQKSLMVPDFERGGVLIVELFATQHTPKLL